jgi:hypothetical protein
MLHVAASIPRVLFTEIKQMKPVPRHFLGFKLKVTDLPLAPMNPVIFFNRGSESEAGKD